MNWESPTLDLANHCLWFVTGFFEVVSTSAPHIYHSALLLCPKESIVQTLYGSQVQPMVKVVQGIPALWNPIIAHTRLPSPICTAAWSPCGIFIAIACHLLPEIIILDAGTLKQLHKICPPPNILTWHDITFSPGSHLLSAHSQGGYCIISWDLQTGGLLSNISTKEHGLCSSITYSECETMIGGLFGSNTIMIHNVLSGICTSIHLIQQAIHKPIWTHGKYLQFATPEISSITKWQVSFTSSYAPTMVGSLSIPDNFSSNELVLLPTLSRLAFVLGGEVMVWDAQNHKVLLHSVDIEDPRAMSFSPDGHFFSCGAAGSAVHIWKESPTGYLPHQNLVSESDGTRKTTLISPNGDSGIMYSASMLQLWHTTSSPTHLPSISMQASEQSEWTFVEFSPDKLLVAVAMRLTSTVTVLDLKSGNPWLIIDTGTKICGLRMTQDEIIIVGNGKIVTWALPGKDYAFNTRTDINNSIQTTTFNHSAPVEDLYTSISPDLNYVAFQDTNSEDLSIYNKHTGEKLAVVTSGHGISGFTPDSHILWCARFDDEMKQWEIVGENESNAIQLEKLGENMKLPGGLPWQSFYGYEVTSDGWIVSPIGKNLLWLPHQWRHDSEMQRKWNGKLLAVWNGSSPKPYILELEV